MTTVISRDRDGSEVLTIRIDADAQAPALTWVADPVCEVVERCRAVIAARGSGRIIVVLQIPGSASESNGPLVEAAVAALQGLVHSLTLEVGREIALNLVVVPGADEALAAETVSYLASDDAAWVLGSTFDLREDQ